MRPNSDHVLLLLCIGWIYFLTQSIVWTVALAGYIILILAILNRIQPYIQHFLWKYAFPDWLFIDWYRYGVMDEDAYRHVQENGYMDIDLDPEYIERDTRD